MGFSSPARKILTTAFTIAEYSYSQPWIEKPPLIKRNLAWGVLPEKLGGGVRPTPQNLYPIYDQILRVLLPFL